VEVLEVGLQVLLEVLDCDSTQSRCAVSAQRVEGLAKKIEIHAVNQAGKRPDPDIRSLALRFAESCVEMRIDP
jgi:hypothetical protein